MYRQKEAAYVPEVAKCNHNGFASNRVVRDLPGMHYLMAIPALRAIPVFRGDLLDTFWLHDRRLEGDLAFAEHRRASTISLLFLLDW
jgi:hypothetical protein